MIGAAIAVGCAMILRGRGGDPISHAAGSGVLDPGALGEKDRFAHDIDAGEIVPPGLDSSGRPAPGSEMAPSS